MDARVWMLAGRQRSTTTRPWTVIPSNPASFRQAPPSVTAGEGCSAVGGGAEKGEGEWTALNRHHESSAGGSTAVGRLKAPSP